MGRVMPEVVRASRAVALPPSRPGVPGAGPDRAAGSGIQAKAKPHCGAGRSASRGRTCPSSERQQKGSQRPGSGRSFRVRPLYGPQIVHLRRGAGPAGKPRHSLARAHPGEGGAGSSATGERKPGYRGDAEALSSCSCLPLAPCVPHGPPNIESNSCSISMSRRAPRMNAPLKVRATPQRNVITRPPSSRERAPYDPTLQANATCNSASHGARKCAIHLLTG